MNNDALIEEIDSAYRRLNGATEKLASADRKLAEHIRRVRLDSAEAILEAKNERTASLYLDGLLDTAEHRRIDEEHVVSVYSDSSYLVNCMRRGWYKKWRENGWINSRSTPARNLWRTGTCGRGSWRRLSGTRKCDGGR